MNISPFFNHRSIRLEQEAEITRTIAACQASIHEHEAGQRGVLKEIEYQKTIRYQDYLNQRLPQSFKRNTIRHWAIRDRDDEINRLEWLLYWHDQCIVQARNSILAEGRRLSRLEGR